MKSSNLCALVLLLSGCSANWNAIHVREEAGKTPTVSVDAKQRFLVATPRNMVPRGEETYATARNDPPSIICTEPSPDALSMLSSSFAGGAGLNLTRPDNTQIAAQLNAALSRAESGAYVGLRTQTIQLLRDGMYRLCEGYAAGALNGKEFKDLQRRYQSVMLALLSIEQITGAIAPRPVVISGGAGAMTGDSLQAVQEKYAEAIEKNVSLESDAAKKKADVTAKKQAVADAEKKIKDCAVPCATLTDLEGEKEKAKTALVTAEQASVKADEAVKLQKAYVAQLEVAVQKAGQTLKTLASGGVPSATFDPTETNRAVMSSAAATAIADTARRIVAITQIGGFGLESCWNSENEITSVEIGAGAKTNANSNANDGSKNSGKTNTRTAENESLRAAFCSALVKGLIAAILPSIASTDTLTSAQSEDQSAAAKDGSDGKGTNPSRSGVKGAGRGLFELSSPFKIADRIFEELDKDIRESKKQPSSTAPPKP
ncbi:MAG: hypothetical protein ACRCWJ_11200 [Casimicrobium sp.]